MASDLNEFFYPRTVALIGATDKDTKPGSAILENLSHFTGAVYPVNPKHATLLGHRCYPSIQAVPEAVDLAVIALPALLVEQEIEAVHAKGIRNVIIISSGFAEAGDAGRDEQQRIRDKVEKYGMRVIGPNALGIYNTDNGLDTFFVSRDRVSRPPRGRLSIVSQSGAITVILMEALARDGMGIAKAVNYGNRLDVDDADCLDYLADDPLTSAVVMYMESVGDGQQVPAGGKEAGIPETAGHLESGQARDRCGSGPSHTATLAGQYGLYQAAIRQAGAIEA